MLNVEDTGGTDMEGDVRFGTVYYSVDSTLEGRPEVRTRTSAGAYIIEHSPGPLPLATGIMLSLAVVPILIVAHYLTTAARFA